MSRSLRTSALAVLSAFLISNTLASQSSARLATQPAPVAPFAGNVPYPVQPAPFIPSATNPAIKIRVLVLNFEPLVPSEGNRRLWEVFRWHDPRALAAGFVRDLSYATNGAVVPEIVEWRNLEEFPVFTDGSRFTAEEYVAMRRNRNAKWPGGTSDVRAILKSHGVPELINSGQIDEVWLFGDHYFALGGEDWMAGPGAFFVNGSVWPDFPVDRAFAGYGFNYERHGAEMLHNLAHRIENHMPRAFGKWDRARPTTTWDKFAAVDGRAAGVAGCGYCHFPPNGQKDYDYTNPRTVTSHAVDWMAFPNLTGKTGQVDVRTWAVEGTPRGLEHLQYQRWWFSHLPRADGADADGRQHNWFKYIFDFNGYAPRTGLPRDNEAIVWSHPHATEGSRRISIRVYDRQGLEATAFHDGDVEAISGSTHLPAKLVSVGPEDRTTAGFARTAWYQVSLPPGEHSLELKPGALVDRAGKPVRASKISVRVAGPEARLPAAALLAAGQARVTLPTVDIGAAGDLFDGDASTLIRTKAVNPAVIRLELDTPATIAGTSLRMSNGHQAKSYRWSLAAADNVADLEARSGTFRVLFEPREADSDADVSASLGKPTTAKVFELTARRLIGDDFVHLTDWQLLLPGQSGQSTRAPVTAGQVAIKKQGSGADRAVVSVQYAGKTFIDRRTIGNDLKVTAADGNPVFASVREVEPGPTPHSVRVTYTIPAQGALTVEVIAGQVSDIDGNTVGKTPLGTVAGVTPPASSRPTPPR